MCPSGTEADIRPLCGRDLVRTYSEPIRSYEIGLALRGIETLKGAQFSLGDLQLVYSILEMLSPARRSASPASSASTGKSGKPASGAEKRVQDIICLPTCPFCDHKIFSLNTLPSSCPECGNDLTQYSFRDLPFKLPSPLTRAQVNLELCSVIRT